jgi:hypothetical protein
VGEKAWKDDDGWEEEHPSDRGYQLKKDTCPFLSVCSSRRAGTKIIILPRRRHSKTEPDPTSQAHRIRIVKLNVEDPDRPPPATSASLEREGNTALKVDRIVS